MKKILLSFAFLAITAATIQAQEIVVIKKNSKDSSDKPLIVLDGVISENKNISDIAPTDIQSINVIKGKMANKKYGTKGDHGVVEITSKQKGNGTTITSQHIIIDTVIASDIDTVINQNTNLSILVNGDKITINGKPADKNDPRLKIIKRKGSITAIAPKGEIKAFGGTPEEEMEFNMDEMMAPPPPPSNPAFLGVITEKSEKAVGAVINTVSEESPAQKAGLKVNDIITKINDKKVDGPSSLYEAIGSYSPEEKVTVTYIRAGKEAKATAVLAKNKANNMNRSFSFVIPNGQMPNNFKRGFRISPDQNFNIEIPEMPEMPEGSELDGLLNKIDGSVNRYDKKPKLGISIEDTESGEGVRIKNVNAGSAAEKAGLKVNDIITQFDNKKVIDVSDLKWEYLLEGQVLKFSILRNGDKKNIEVKIPKKLKTANL
jgi:serine protease Do